VIPQHICSCFSSSYVWFSSQIYNNLLTISDFPPSSSVLMNLFTLMERKQFHLSCAISLVYSTSPVKVRALQVFHFVSLFSSPSVICFFFSFPSFCFPCPSWFPWSWSYTLSCFVDLASSMAESSQFTTCLVTET
jgi:hypothetical protein